jgi:hypothetical protein
MTQPEADLIESMTTYTTGPSAEAIQLNRGTEVVASTPIEAAKLGRRLGAATVQGFIVVQSPNGAQTDFIITPPEPTPSN